MIVRIKADNMLLISLIIASIVSLTLQDGPKSDRFRPKYHLTSPEGNDGYVDGLTKYKEKYYFYFQVYYNSTQQKSIYWGHRETTDFINWKEYVDYPALYPTNMGLPFSGGMVVDKNNDAGFQKSKNDPDTFVAMLTRHNAPNDDQLCGPCNTQEIWFSRDKGFTFYPYKGNPVIKRPHADKYGAFFDPYPRRFKNKWIVPITVESSCEFYESYDLINWKYLSTFGPGEGAQGDYWECPDLTSFKINGKEVYVLIVSVYNGGPNVGGGTQYFVGDFDGKQFNSFGDPDSYSWVDHGPDFYCFKTFVGLPNDEGTIGIALAANSDDAPYPTYPWRNTYTVPRSVELIGSDGDYSLQTNPISAILSLKKDTIFDVKPDDSSYLDKSFKAKSFYFKTEIIVNDLIVIKFYNKEYYVDIILTHGGTILIDRSNSGIEENEQFKTIITDQRFNTNSPDVTFEIFYDNSIMEIFLDGGLVSLTVLVFPDPPYDHVSIKSSQKRSMIKYAKMYQFGSIDQKYIGDSSHDRAEENELNQTKLQSGLSEISA